MAPPSRHDFPKELYAFAQKLQGTYEERYPEILNHAFIEHKLLLNALNLKMIAGGGSHAVAQAAVDSWKSQLHAMLAQRVDVGGELPQELSARFSSALIDLWTLSRKYAAADLEAREIVLRNEAAEAEERAADLRTRLDAEIELSKKVHGQLEDARSSGRAMQAEIAALQLRVEKAQRDQEALVSEHATQMAAQAQLAADLRDQVKSLEAQLERAAASLREEADRAAAERENMRKQSMLELDRVRTEARKELATAKEATAKVSEALSKSAAEIVTLRSTHVAELNEIRSRYREETMSAQSAAELREAHLQAEVRRLQDAAAAGQRERELLQSALDREARAGQAAATSLSELERVVQGLREKKS